MKGAVICGYSVCNYQDSLSKIEKKNIYIITSNVKYILDSLHSPTLHIVKHSISKPPLCDDSFSHISSINTNISIWTWLQFQLTKELRLQILFYRTPSHFKTLLYALCRLIYFYIFKNQFGSNKRKRGEMNVS